MPATISAMFRLVDRLSLQLESSGNGTPYSTLRSLSSSEPELIGAQADPQSCPSLVTGMQPTATPANSTTKPSTTNRFATLQSLIPAQ